MGGEGVGEEASTSERLYLSWPRTGPPTSCSP